MIKKENFLVIGLGRFGSNVAKVFYENGHDVLAIDNEMEAVQKTIDAKLVDNAMQIDATDSNSLKKIEIEESEKEKELGLRLKDVDNEHKVINTEKEYEEKVSRIKEGIRIFYPSFVLLHDIYKKYFVNTLKLVG
mgnify:CR=1 FL=1